jgi:hypothetical protein
MHRVQALFTLLWKQLIPIVTRIDLNQGAAHTLRVKSGLTLGGVWAPTRLGGVIMDAATDKEACAICRALYRLTQKETNELIILMELLDRRPGRRGQELPGAVSATA